MTITCSGKYDTQDTDATNIIDHDAYKEDKVKRMAAQIPFIRDIINNNSLALQSSSTAIKKLLYAHPEIPLKDVLPRYLVPILTEKGVEIVDFFDETSFKGGIEFIFNYFFNDPNFTYETYKNMKRTTNSSAEPNPITYTVDPNLDDAESIDIY